MSLYYVRNRTTPATGAPSTSPHGYVVEGQNFPDPGAAYKALGAGFPVNPGDTIEAVLCSAVASYAAVGTITFSQGSSPTPPPVGT